MTRVPALEANVVVRVFVVLVEMAAVGTGKAYNNGYLFCGTTYRGIVDVVVVVVVVIVVIVVVVTIVVVVVVVVIVNNDVDVVVDVDATVARRVSETRRFRLKTRAVARILFGLNVVCCCCGCGCCGCCC